MSHFSVLVASPTTEVETLLAPFDENLELPRYLARTKEQIIEDGRREIDDYATKGLYAEFIEDPAGYIRKHIESGGRNYAHLAYLAVEFPKKLRWNDDEVYAAESTWIESEDLDENGAEWSTSNPNAKWDYWRIGGRWAGHLRLNPGATGLLGRLSWEWADTPVADRPSPTTDADQAVKRDVDIDATKHTYAVLLADGTWIARGAMGWFGFSRDDLGDDNWPALWREAVDSIPADHVLTVVDCHI